MKILHLINKKNDSSFGHAGLTHLKEEPHHYTSCCWDIKEDKAKALVGGMVFLHHTKAEASFMGGVVVDVQPATFENEAQKDRFQIKFRSTLEGRNITWRGKSHTLSYKGDVIDVDE